jgi:uncharacterized protein (TIGR03435 family)
MWNYVTRRRKVQARPELPFGPPPLVAAQRRSVGRNRLRWLLWAVMGLAPARVGILGLGAGQLLAQSRSETSLPRPDFEVVSIELNRSRNLASGFGSLPDRLTIINHTVKDIIAAAYNVRDSQVVGGEAWTGSERFDVNALVAPWEVEQLERLTPEEREVQRRLSLQSVLADRFHLKVSSGTEQVPMYALEASKDGPKLRRTRPEDRLGIGTLGVSGGELTGQGIPMSSARDMCLVRMLETQVGRIVIDRTGLEGNYTFTLQWTPDGSHNTFSSGGCSIFTALQEQLGLELQSIVGTVPTIVIDHIEEPS